MIINDTIINASCEEVLTELRRQLVINQIPYLQKTIDSGRNIQVQCPYHGNGQERRPSAGIRKEDGLFHCFACGQAHTLPEVISYCFGKNDISGMWGMKWIIKNFATVQVEERKAIELNLDRNKQQKEETLIKYITEEELDSYRYYHNYWTSRGIIDDNIIELFDLGYDIKTDCITFPVKDEKGNCVFVARRNVKTKWFNYPKDVEKPLYGLYELHTYYNSRRPNNLTDIVILRKNSIDLMPKKLYITESMIDCLLLWQVGKYAVALNGTGSEQQIATLCKLPIRHYVIATDNDEAGIRARKKLEKRLKNKMVTHIEFPNNIKDIGDLGKAKRIYDIENIDRWEVF